MKVQSFEFLPTSQIIAVTISYELQDDLTGEIISKEGRIEMPAAEIDLTDAKTFDDVLTHIAIAITPKTSSKKEVTVATAEEIVLP
mgnify:CR=1 FL=1